MLFGAETAVATVALALAITGLALVPVTGAPVVRALVIAVGADDAGGLDRSAALATAESVRRFVLDRRAPGLPATIDGRSAFDDAAVSHLVDVREILIPARRLALALGALLALWAWRRRTSADGQKVLRAAIRAAGWAVLGVGSFGLVAGALDFDALFARFHGLLFAPGTWQFPSDALLIQVFPLPFWIAAGALWAVLASALATALVLAARSPHLAARSDGV